MPNYLFDMRFTASVRIDAATEAEARAMVIQALEYAEMNAGCWPDGSPILLDAALDNDDVPDDEAVMLVEVDGEPHIEDEPLPPVPIWAAPMEGLLNARRAAMAQEAASAMKFIAASQWPDKLVSRITEGEDPISPTIGDALAYGMGALHVGLDFARDESVTVLMVRIAPEELRGLDHREEPNDV